MKKILAVAAALTALAAPAFAADLPMKAAPMPAPVWTWTGFYIGGYVGAGWGETESTVTGFSAAIPGVPGIAGTASFPFNQNSRSGFLGGGQAGYNWQSGLVVFGVEGDFSGLDVKGTDPCLVLLSCTSKSDWLATASARVGVDILDRGLIYVKGGGAWLHSTNSVDLPSLTIGGVSPLGALGGANLTNGSYGQPGALIGLGTEWMITPNWTAFIEYDYMRFENKGVSFSVNPALLAPATVIINTNQTNTLSIAKVGVNYKFNLGGPVVAKY